MESDSALQITDPDHIPIARITQVITVSLVLRAIRNNRMVDKIHVKSKENN
jgi:hypothetical protein